MFLLFVPYIYQRLTIVSCLVHPVSYTHLWAERPVDRAAQIVIRIKLLFLITFLLILSLYKNYVPPARPSAPYPVSYTHLDVYKRQGQPSVHFTGLR